MARNRFLAKILDSDIIKRSAPQTWQNWLTTTELYRNLPWRDGKAPPDAGDLLVQNPYSDFFNLTWGLQPNQDMPKWRWMYRARPEVNRGINIKVQLAVGKGFNVICEENQELEDYANKLLERLNIRQALQSATTDMFVYGQAYFEEVRTSKNGVQDTELLAETGVTRKWNSAELDIEDPRKAMEEWAKDFKQVDGWLASTDGKTRFEAKMKAMRERFSAQTTTDKSKKMAPPEGELVELKPLDPLWMRVNRDAFNNVLGFVQWGLTPIPQAIIPEKIVYLPWMPKSWSYESAYGTSILMSITRHVSLLIQAEEDMKVWYHQYAKPMRAVYAGTPDKPYPLPALNVLKASMQSMLPTSDAVVPGDVKIEVVRAGTGETTTTFKEWIDYLTSKIYEAIGIPTELSSIPVSNRAAADVKLQYFIAEQKMVQSVLADQFMKQAILPELRRVFGDKLPRIRTAWPSILEDDRNKVIDRLIKATGAPFMSRNEARAEAGFRPLEDDKYDELVEQAQAGFGQLSKGPEPSESERTGPREEEKQKLDRR